jgi:Carboxypeptidase regulatory-like domain
MNRTFLRNLLLFVFLGLSGSAFAQEISGTVVDDKKQPLINASVAAYQGGALKNGTVTDYDGKFVIKPLDPGSYTVFVISMGFDTLRFDNVLVSSGTTPLMAQMAKPQGISITGVTVIGYTKPLVSHYDHTTVIPRTELAQKPTNSISDAASSGTNTYQQKRGDNLSFTGGRTGETKVIIDGVQVRGGNLGIDQAQSGVEQVEVITSGIPANYGDVSGGVINITSRSVSRKLTGEVRVQHSIDGYNNNLLSFGLSGPLYKKKMPGQDKAHKKPVLGFTVAGDYYKDHDRYPTYNQEYVTNGAKLSNLQKNPLQIGTDNSGQPVYNLASDYVTLADLHQSKIPPHNVIQEERINGKLDFQVSDNMRVVGGGSFNSIQQDAYSRARNLFAPEATPVTNTITGRAYLRFTQKFGKAGDTSSRHSIVSNAFYKIQADYQKTYVDQHDPNFKENIFEYGYVGKFNETRQDVYFPLQTDSASNRKGTVLTLSLPTGISFEADAKDRNHNLANYTREYYNSLPNGRLPQFISNIEASNGIANGDEPKYTYDLFYSPGATQSYFYKQNANQYALDVSASFDLLLGKTKHAIEFGLYYQQRIERFYEGVGNLSGDGTNSIWQQMRQLVSSIDNGNLKYDKQHPIFRVNGQNYNYVADGSGIAGHGYFTDQSGNIKNINPGPSDTILYNYQNIGNSTFDANLRKKLKLNSTQDINIDALDPSTFSLNMFSADELLNSGRQFVYYYGYTYTGDAQTGNVNFNDFWTKKDANGNYTRPIGAFTPNYIAGYLLDRFNYKDMHFNVGVRIDRFSSNEKVLIDPYSEYAEKNVTQYDGSHNLINGGKHPANMGNNYVVYVDDNTSSAPNIIGYRSGNNWYDASGKYINDPSILKQYSGGRDPQPAIVKVNGNLPNIADSNFNPNNSFTDYTPQVTVQPRIQFSFPISDVADFYAHYDIYSQRPSSNSRTDPSTYYYMAQNANLIINNSDLKPQKTFDYEVGFQQKLTEHSALTITAFYKERKDMITVVPYLYAWPTTYFTYGNRDFSTTKGTSYLYDLRATNHLRMTLAYTLQFAEGTGSTPTSTNRGGGGQISPNGLLQAFITAGQPNLRYVTPLDVDSRHNITADIDYRYKAGEGPMIGNKPVFENTGLHIVGKARSGEPYTRFIDALGNTVIGGVATSRLPWHYGIDLRLDKDFLVSGGKKAKGAPEGVKPKRPLYVRGILQVNNVLNTRDVLGVYGYTGKPDDNGYLSSSYGRQFAPQQINQQSYTDLYRIATNSPGNLNYARTISLALEFNF